MDGKIVYQPGNKRPPSFVPRSYSNGVRLLSKADLMDIAWSFAQRLVGEEDDTRAFLMIESEHNILAANDGRKPIAIRKGVG